METHSDGCADALETLSVRRSVRDKHSWRVHGTVRVAGACVTGLSCGLPLACLAPAPRGSAGALMDGSTNGGTDGRSRALDCDDSSGWMEEAADRLLHGCGDVNTTHVAKLAPARVSTGGGTRGRVIGRRRFDFGASGGSRASNCPSRALARCRRMKLKRRSKCAVARGSRSREAGELP